MPGSRYYKATKAEAWFATTEDAERAGFSAPPSASDTASRAEAHPAEADSDEATSAEESDES